MVNQPRHLRLSGATGRLRVASYQGRDHVVVPVTALVEGVIWPVNAQMPEYVPASTVALPPLGWDGRPVVLGHPAVDGVQVSANTPNRWDSLTWGQVFNSASGDALVMDAYLDPVRAATVPGAARALQRLRSGETVEVSVGVWVTLEDALGTFQCQDYRGVWRDIRPDHLAFLAEGTIGACSIEMGCGALRHASRHVITDHRITRLTTACSCAPERTAMQNDPNVTTPSPTHDALRDLVLLANDLDARTAQAERAVYENEMARLRAAQNGSALPPIDLNARLRAGLRGAR